MANFVEIDAELINLDQVTNIRMRRDCNVGNKFYLEFLHFNKKILSMRFDDSKACNAEYKKWKEKLVKSHYTTHSVASGEYSTLPKERLT